IRFCDLYVLDDCCASSRSQRLTLHAAAGVLNTDPLSRVQRNLCSSAVRPVHCAGSELVVFVFEQDVGCMISDVVSRHLPPQSTATLAALPAMSLIPFAPF